MALTVPGRPYSIACTDRGNRSRRESPTSFPAEAKRSLRDWSGYWTRKLDRELSLRNYSPETVRNYSHCLRRFLKMRPGTPRKWTSRRISEHLLGLRLESGLSTTTVNLHHDALNFFCLHVLNRPQSVAGIPYQKRTQKVPRVLTVEEAKAVIEAAHGAKHHLLLSLAYGCGLRLAELIHLQIAGLDFTRRMIKVHGKIFLAR